MFKRLRNTVAPPSVEQRATLISGKQITYTLKRSGKRRSIGLRIDDRGLTVSMPLRASEKWLNSVLQDKANWVVEKLDCWQTQKPRENIWRNGETIDYLGELLVLRIEQCLFASPAERRGKELWIFAADTDDLTFVEREVSLWYRIQAEHFFSCRVAHYAPLLNVMPQSLKLSEAKSQWGSCTAQGSIRLNVQLIELPPKLIDYVVIHELAHLRELNHSAAFWQVVNSVCPDYASLRSELKAVAIR